VYILSIIIEITLIFNVVVKCFVYIYLLGKFCSNLTINGQAICIYVEDMTDDVQYIKSDDRNSLEKTLLHTCN